MNAVWPLLAVFAVDASVLPECTYCGKTEATHLLQSKAQAVHSGPEVEVNSDQQKRVHITASGELFLQRADLELPEANDASRVGINLSVKWMDKPLSPTSVIEALPRIQEHLGLRRKIRRVKTFDLSPTNVELLAALAKYEDLRHVVVGVSNEELPELDGQVVSNLLVPFRRRGVAVHVALGNEPDINGVPAGSLLHAIDVMRTIPLASGVQLTVPFAYSIMGEANTISTSSLRPQFLSSYGRVLQRLDYVSINIYPFLNAGTTTIPLRHLNGPGVRSLRGQLAAFRSALSRAFPDQAPRVTVGETGWPSCGRSRAAPYAHATVAESQRFYRNVAAWLESDAFADEVDAGFLFTAFDEESKGTRVIERYYGIFESTGRPKDDGSCSRTDGRSSTGWMESTYPECENDIDWLISNIDNPEIHEKFVGRGLDGSLCSLQQFLYDSRASCPPVSRIPGREVVFEGGHTFYRIKTEETLCRNRRIAKKYVGRSVGREDSNGLAPKFVSSSLYPTTPLWQSESAEFFMNILWINLDSSVERRSAMDSMFEQFLTSPASGPVRISRVPAVTGAEVRDMVKNQSLYVGADLIDECSRPCPFHHARGEMLYSEVAVTLSHLDAIGRAHGKGCDHVLILEDDVFVRPELLEDLPALLKEASEGWKFMQLVSTNSKVLESLASSRERIVGWQPNSHGTGAYLLSRLGIADIVERYKGNRIWNSDHSGASALSTEALLFGAMSAGEGISTTRFYVGTTESQGVVKKIANTSNWTISTNSAWQTYFLDRHVIRRGSSAPITAQHEKEPQEFQSILGITVVHCDEGREFKQMVQSLLRTIKGLNNTGVDWKIFGLATGAGNNFWACRRLQQLNQLADVQYRAVDRNYSRWSYLTEFPEQLEKYGFVLLFESDMDLASVAWTDFFQRKQDYASRWIAPPITGALRKLSPYFALRPEWWQSCERNARYVEVDFVEQAFALLNGSFASWYFSHLLHTDLISTQANLGLDWGPDAIWCGAAAEWAGSVSGCLLVTLEVEQNDVERPVRPMGTGEHLVNAFWATKPDWMKTSEIWMGPLFQDPAFQCSPFGLEERYHMPIHLRSEVPIVPTGVPVEQDAWRMAPWVQA